MDNVIPPLSNPSGNISGTEGSVSGNIPSLPPEVQIAIKPGQSYLLEILMTEGMDFGSAIKAEIDVSGQKIPVEIELETPVKLPKEQGGTIQVKFNNINEKGQADIKLLAVNNEKVIRQPTQTQNTALMQNIETSSPLFNISTNKNIFEFHPLKLGTLLKSMSIKLHLPNMVGQVLEENFQKAEIRVNLRLEANSSSATFAEGNTIKNAMHRIELVIKNFTENFSRQKPQAADIEHFIFQIKNELLPLKNALMTGTAFSNPDSKLLALRTTLGNFLPDKPMKLDNLSNVLLEIKDIRFGDSMQPTHLEELSASRNLTQNLPSMLDIFKDLLSASVQPQSETDKLLDIFKTLHDLGKDNLAGKIMQKFPSLEGKVLENMFHFIKAANQHNSELWLGKEVMQDLRNLGSDGQEISTRLNDFMNTSIREGSSWKIINLPIIHGEQLSRIRLAIRNIQEEEARKERGKNKKSARFVVDTSFSKLGAFQFDGFSFVKDRQFDLIIRTSQAIDNDLKNNIFGIFKTTLHNLNYTGTIKINVKENFIKICEDENKEETLKQGLYV